MNPPSFYTRVVSVVTKNCSFHFGAPLVIAVSGGPDSIALFHILNYMNQKEELGFEMHIAHLNHKLRCQEADEDAKFVEELAVEHNIKFWLRELNVRKIAESQRGTLEEVARGERYKFLKEIAEKIGAQWVAVGHTADDNAETVLHRIIRGTGSRGLRGIAVKRAIAPASNIEIIRPLINVWREEILDYLNQSQIPFRIDSSNLEVSFLRNRIRQRLLPLLEKEYNKNVKTILIHLADIVRVDYEYLSILAQEAFAKILLRSSENEVVLDIPPLLQEHLSIQRLIVYRAAELLGARFKAFSYNHYHDVLRIAANESNKVTTLPHGLVVEKCYNELRFRRVISNINNDLYRPLNESLHIPGTTYISEHQLRIDAEILDEGLKLLGSKDDKKFVRSGTAKTHSEELFDLGKLELPLGIRWRKPGDRFKPLGMKGHKKLKDFMIDLKIPEDDRHRIPIITMNDKPIWVVGYRIADEVKLTENTRRVLRLRVTLL